MGLELDAQANRDHRMVGGILCAHPKGRLATRFLGTAPLPECCACADLSRPVTASKDWSHERVVQRAFEVGSSSIGKENLNEIYKFKVVRFVVLVALLCFMAMYKEKLILILCPCQLMNHTGLESLSLFS